MTITLGSLLMLLSSVDDEKIINNSIDGLHCYAGNPNHHALENGCP